MEITKNGEGNDAGKLNITPAPGNTTIQGSSPCSSCGDACSKCPECPACCYYETSKNPEAIVTSTTAGETLLFFLGLGASKLGLVTIKKRTEKAGLRAKIVSFDNFPFSQKTTAALLLHLPLLLTKKKQP